MRKLATFLHVIDVISEWTGKIDSFIIVLIIGTAVYWMLQRKLLFPASLDYAAGNRIFFIYVILGAAYALRAQAHVKVDILYNHLSPRVKSIADLVTSIALFLFCVALLWMAAKTAADTFSRGFQLSLRTFLPWNWPVTLVVPVGVSLFILQGLSKFVRDLIMAITGKKIS